MSGIDKSGLSPAQADCRQGGPGARPGARQRARADRGRAGSLRPGHVLAGVRRPRAWLGSPRRRRPRGPRSRGPGGPGLIGGPDGGGADRRTGLVGAGAAAAPSSIRRSPDEPIENPAIHRRQHACGGRRPQPARDRAARARSRRCLGRALRGRPMRSGQSRLHRCRLRPGQRRRLRVPLSLRGGRGRELAADQVDHRSTAGPVRPDLVDRARRDPDRRGGPGGADAQ